jgi:MFS family permease
VQEVRKPSGGESRFFYGYIVVLMAFAIMVIVGGTMFAFGVFFTPLSADFGWTRALTSGAFSLFMVVHGLLSIVVGRLTDRFGPRIVVTLCGFFIGLGYLLMSQISSAWQLYLFYGVIIGVGMGGGFIPQLSTVARWFVKRRGLMSGISIAGIGVGTMVIPSLANWLISDYGWPISYVVMGFIVLVVILSAAQFLWRDPGQIGQLPYGHNELLEEDLTSKVKEFSLREAMRTSQFWLLCGAYLGFGLFLQAVMVHIVPHTIVLGIPSAAAATVLVFIGGFNILGKVAIGGVADRIGNKSALIISFVLTTAALAWLLVANEMWMFYLFAALFGIAYGGLAALPAPVVADLFGLSSHGVIFGVIVFLLTIGGALGPVLAGGIFDVMGSYDWAFVTCLVTSAIGLTLTALLKPTKKS